MVAIYHFAWVFLTIISPLLLLFHLFSSQITVNLFRSMFEVACWRVVWSVLSVMLKALPFGTWYAMEGNYLTIIVLNFVIALCMIGTPLLVRSLFGGGLTAMTGGLVGATTAMMLAAPAKALAVTQIGRGVLGDVTGFGRGIASQIGSTAGRFLSSGMEPSPTPPPAQAAGGNGGSSPPPSGSGSSTSDKSPTSSGLPMPPPSVSSNTPPAANGKTDKGSENSRGV
jgi:hypothetical protein